jgi:NAD(P)-dependent dehydrogenase (short-subunit alcohol dehydrogenase family)
MEALRSEQIDFTGLTSLVTGGAGGIGRAIGISLARRGSNVILADQAPERLAESSRQVSRYGVDVLELEVDVTDIASVRKMRDRAMSRFGAVDILCNNAGVLLQGPVTSYSHEDWSWCLAVNLGGVVNGIETFLPDMLASKSRSHIVNTGSFAGLVPNDGLVAYCAAKYGVVGLSEALARDLRDTAVGISVLCPMSVRTDLGTNSNALRPSDQASMKVETTVDGSVTADEVGELVVEGIRSNALYIMTDPSALRSIERRTNRLRAAFEPLHADTPIRLDHESSDE